MFDTLLGRAWAFLLSHHLDRLELRVGQLESTTTPWLASWWGVEDGVNR